MGKRILLIALMIVLFSAVIASQTLLSSATELCSIVWN
jgi:hypothetical protein